MLSLKVKTGGQIILVPIKDILPPENYSRIVISSEELEALKESIEKNGILSPITVRSAPEGKYIVVSGERRRRAAKSAGFRYVPCILVNFDDLNSEIFDICENIHRKNLHYLECAQAIDRLHGIYSVGELSDLLSIPEGVILSRIRLLSLPENIKWKIISSDLNESVAGALCGIKDTDKMNRIADIVISTGMSFNDAVKIINEQKESPVLIAHYKDLTVFENTIEHAVKVMKSSGICSESVRNENNTHIVYTISIKKMI